MKNKYKYILFGLAGIIVMLFFVYRLGQSEIKSQLIVNQFGGAQVSVPVATAPGQILMGLSTGNWTPVSTTTGGLFRTTTEIWVDSNRTDSYTADGTNNRPFKSILASIQTVPAVYHIAPGTYIESPLTFTATSTIEANQATIIGTTLRFNTGVIVDNGVLLMSNIYLADKAVSDPGTFQNSLVSGNIYLYGLAIFNGGQTQGGIIYTGVNSLTNFIGVNILSSQILSDGTINLDDDNVQPPSSAGLYAIVATTTGSSVNINGVSLENTAANGGGVYCANGATTVPNNINALTMVLGTTSNSGSIQCGNSVSLIGSYSAFTTLGVRLYAVSPNVSSYSFDGINVETNTVLAQNSGTVAISTTTCPFMLCISSSTATNNFKPQLDLIDQAGGLNLKHWVLASEGGMFSISSSSDLYSTSSIPAFAITSVGTTTIKGLNILGGVSGTSTSAVGFNLTTGCFAIAGTCIGSGSGSGSVTSVGLSLPSFFTVTNSPVTTSGTLTATVAFPSNAILTADSAGTNIIATTSQLTVGSLLATSTTGWSIFNNDGIMFGTSTPTISPFLAVFASSTRPQIALSAGAGIAQWTFRNAGGNLYISSTTAQGLATTSTAALTICGSCVPGLSVSTSTPWAKFAMNVNNRTDFSNIFAIGTSTDVLGASSRSVLLLNNNGYLGLGTTSPASLFSLNGVANFGLATSSFYTVGGINIAGGCFSIAGTCISGGSGSGTVTSVGTGYGLHQGPVTTSGTISASTYANFVVSTTTNSGDFTDIQTAINSLPAGGGKIHVTCGTFTLSATTTIKVANTVIEGEGVCTQFNVNAPTIFRGFVMNATGLTGIVLKDFYLHQTSGTQAGIGVDASNTPLIIVDTLKIDGFATATSIRDTASANQSFYMTFKNLDLRDNKSCVDIGGAPVNDNSFLFIRCALHSGSGGFAYYIDSSSANGAQHNLFTHINSEPTGAATGLTAIYCNNCVDNTFDGYIEGNAVAYNFTANSQRNKISGEFVTNTTYTNAGSNNSFEHDKEGSLYSALTASSTIADVSGNDASVPSYSFIGNANFAKAAAVIDIKLGNGTDSGPGVKVVDAGTGAGLSSYMTGTGQAASTTGKVFMNALTVTSTGNALCLSTTTFQLENAGATACIASTKKAKHDIQNIPLSVIDEVMALRPVQYTLNGSNEQRYGFIAEEVAKIDPKLVEYAQQDSTVPGIDGKDVVVKKGEPLTFDYQRFTGLLTAKVQDLQKQIDGFKGIARSMEENWQDILIGLLVAGFIYQQWQIRKLKKQ